jgi:hypothetical protein
MTDFLVYLVNYNVEPGGRRRRCSSGYSMVPGGLRELTTEELRHDDIDDIHRRQRCPLRSVSKEGTLRPGR